MRDHRTMELGIVAAVLLAGAWLFVRAVGMADAVPEAYRSASPGFGWAWDFDYRTGMDEAGRFGEAPWPWPARASDGRVLLPRDQPLSYRGLTMVYRGMIGTDRFGLAVSIAQLDPDVTYPREIGVDEARRGLTIDDRRFVMETITPRYLRLRIVDH